jgi:hypothetical protein
MSQSKEITKAEKKDIEQARQRKSVIPLVDIYENKDEVLSSPMCQEYHRKM